MESIFFFSSHSFEIGCLHWELQLKRIPGVTGGVDCPFPARLRRIPRGESTSEEEGITERHVRSSLDIVGPAPNSCAQRMLLFPARRALVFQRRFGRVPIRPGLLRQRGGNGGLRDANLRAGPPFRFALRAQPRESPTSRWEPANHELRECNT